MKNETKRAKRQRLALTVYCENPQQLRRIKSAARGNVSRYILDRVLYDDGYADPRHDVAARLMRLADAMSGELHLISDLVREKHALRREVGRSLSYANDDVVRRIVNDIKCIISHLLVSSEKRADLDHDLMGAISDYTKCCAEWELRQERAATLQKRGRSKP